GIESANITFRVNKSFLDSRARDPEDVVMKRFNGGWNELPTRFREETANAYRFVANSDGFSYYAIALEEQVQDQPDQPDEQPDQPQNETGTNETDGTDQVDQDKGGVLPWVAGLLLILAGLAIYFREQLTEFALDLMPDEEPEPPVEVEEPEEEQESDED
ncbi:MAG: PGF-pre-PGF domain-containing protein, partial [Candidatus Nanosalina sp.]